MMLPTELLHSDHATDLLPGGQIGGPRATMQLGLGGKTALVTGGSKGIGLETARLLAAEGADVLIAARRAAGLAEAAAEIEAGTACKVHTVALDVASVEDVAALPSAVAATIGHVDLLVNNAGTGTYKPFLEVSEAELQYGMAVNFFAQFRICQRIIPMMIARGGGRIVNVSGETAIRVMQPPFLSSCTGPAKAAENRLTSILAHEFATHGIRVNAVVPGFVHTPERFAKWQSELSQRPLSNEDAHQERERWSATHGMRTTRWGTPREIANLIVFALSDAASFVNGAVLIADNGLHQA
ncbi:MAG: SDR family oxidoreductase [Hyphomonadaceae bacterium]|nr:SDR family oxidoreductase [Hyphomonadaceae bacterium]